MYNDVETDKICVELPELCVLTDEDSGDEKSSEVDNQFNSLTMSSSRNNSNKRYGGIGDEITDLETISTILIINRATSTHKHKQNK